MEKRIYVCDKCGKEFDDADKIEKYIDFGFTRRDPSWSNCTINMGSVKGDLCQECQQILNERVEKFLENMRTEFNFK